MGDGSRGGRQVIVEVLGPDPDDTSIEAIRQRLDIRWLSAENDHPRDDRPLGDAGTGSHDKRAGARSDTAAPGLAACKKRAAKPVIGPETPRRPGLGPSSD